MEYNKFKQIFNTTIFEKSKPDLLEKVAKYPERYVGLFRPSRPKAKIIQNLLQSHEIRFGDAFETLIQEYLREAGFTSWIISFMTLIKTDWKLIKSFRITMDCILWNRKSEMIMIQPRKGDKLTILKRN